MHTKENVAHDVLRMTYGIVPIVAGLDKFTHLLTDWTAYLSPLITGVLPFSAAAFMKLVGVIEIAAGVLVLLRPTARLGAYVVMAWLVGIALNLVTTGRYFDIAVRDLVMAVGAFALAKLVEAREEEGVTQAVHPRTPARAAV